MCWYIPKKPSTITIKQMPYKEKTSWITIKLRTKKQLELYKFESWEKFMLKVIELIDQDVERNKKSQEKAKKEIDSNEEETNELS